MENEWIVVNSIEEIAERMYEIKEDDEEDEEKKKN